MKAKANARYPLSFRSATACPQDIAYPTDLNLLSDARKKSEQLIDILYGASLHEKKPRQYRKIAR